MSESLWSAGRDTHLKIVAVALVAAIVVVMVGIYASDKETGTATAAIKADRPTLKAGQPASYSQRTKSSLQ
jgi:hypothetical protein